MNAQLKRVLLIRDLYGEGLAQSKERLFHMSQNWKNEEIQISHKEAN